MSNMRRIESFAVGVQQGSELLFDAFQDDGELWSGEGRREASVEIKFNEKYKEPPAVHVSVGMWDSFGGANQRGDIFATDITTTGCRIVFKTWGDSRVGRIRADWMAIGSVRHEDDWDII